MLLPAPPSPFRSLLLALAAAPLSLAAAPVSNARAQAQDMAPQALTLQCLAKTGEGMQLEGGTLLNYFSAGSSWTMVIDTDNAMANVDYRTDKRGNLITFSEKYRTNISSDYYILLSTEIKTGTLSSGVYNIHDIEITINRRTAEYKRILRVQNMNSSTGTYSYLSETGECALKPPTGDSGAPVKY